MRRKISAMALLWGMLVLTAPGAVTTARAREAAPPPKTSPGVTYVVENISVKAAPAAGALQGKMTVAVRHLANGPTWVPLFGGAVGVVSAGVSGGKWFGTAPVLMRRGDRIGILLTGAGEYSVEIDFATPIKKERETRTAPLPMVQALTGIYEITLEGENVDVSLSWEIPYQQEVIAGRTVLKIYPAGEGSMLITWKPGPEVREVERIAFAEHQMLLDISPGLLRVESEIIYTLLQGRMAEVRVRLPAGYSLLKVEGDNLRSWDVQREPDAPATLLVKLLDPAAEKSTLRLSLEKTLDPVPVQVAAPAIEPLDVAREKGVIAVALEKGLQAEIVERSSIGQVNVTEMPARFQSLRERFSLGLKYLARPFAVKLLVSTIEPKVYGEVSCLTVASLERFRQHWDVQYEIRNAGLFQLKVRLAPGMKLISLRGDNINNQSLDATTNVLTIDLRSKAEGAYRLSMQTYSEVEDPAKAALPAIDLLGVERQWGTIALSVDAGGSVETGQLEGISQIDIAELPGMQAIQQILAVQRAPAPLLAFRYLTFPYRLELTVSHIRPELKVEPTHMIRLTRKNLRYHSIFDYTIKKAGVFQVRLHLPPELRGLLTVKGPKVKEHTYDAATEVLTVQLTEKVSDHLRVELEGEAALEAELPRPGETGSFVVPAVYTLDCEQERGHIAIVTEESVRLKRAGDGGTLHDVDVQEVPPALLQRATDAKLAFRLIESPWELKLEVTSISPKIQTQTFNYVRLGEDYLMGTSTVDFTIQYAGVKEFFVRLPEGVTKPNIRGANIKIQEKVKEAARGSSAIELIVGGGAAETKTGELWRVELQGEAKGSYELIIEYTKEVDPKETRREFSGPTVYGEMKEVEREIGYLAVTGDPSLELTPDEEALENLTPVDEEEIPLKFRQLPPSVAEQIGRQTVPILFAFRYLAHPYKLVMSSVRHDEADVVTTVVETCKLDTTLTRDGNRITSLLASVRSRYQPFFEIQLPDGAKLWHALVNGRRVRPLTEKSNTGEITKIPIAQVQGVTGPVLVELQWEELGGDKLNRAEVVNLAVPSLLGVRILRLGWVLQLPRGYRVIGSTGALQRVPSEGYFEDALKSLRPVEQRAGRAQQTAVNEFNSQAISNARLVMGRAAGKEGRWRGPTVAAAKPQLPARFYFQALILNPEVPARVSALCTTAPALHLTIAIVVLAVLGLCALLWHKSGLSPKTSFIVLAALTFVLAGVKLIAEDNFAQLILAALYTVAGAAIVFGATAIVSRFAQRRHEAQVTPHR